MLVPESRTGLRRCARLPRTCLIVLSLLLAEICFPEDAARRVVTRTVPSYPDLARKMHLSGKVKVEVVISPSGAVISAKLVGGNPVFESDAIAAVKLWKFEPGASATKMLIMLDFTRQSPD